MSFLSSMFKVVAGFTLFMSNGFVYQPLTKLRTGEIFTNMLNAINYVDQNGKLFLGQPFGSSSVASKGTYQEAPAYQPGDTTPPPTFPTYQKSGYEVPLGTNQASQYRLSGEGLRHLRAFEGLHQRPYVINGQKYIGYGHKLSEKDDTKYISWEQAESFLASDVSAAEGVVKGAISVKLTQGQFDAMVDFAFTVAPSKFKSSSVVQKMNSGDVAGAATALAQFVYAKQNDVVAKVPHLTARRTSNVHWMGMPTDVQPPP